MKKTLFEISKSVFDKIVGISSDDINFYITNKIEYPKIEFGNKILVTIPSPITLRKQYFLEGNVFSDYQKYSDSIWNLYLCTIYHVAAHVRLSDYTKYESWLKDKNYEKCWNVINFIEDAKINAYLKKSHHEMWQNMELVNMLYDTYYENKIQKNLKYSREQFSGYFGIEHSKKLWREKFTNTLLNFTSLEGITISGIPS